MKEAAAVSRVGGCALMKMTDADINSTTNTITGRGRNIWGVR